ncbi:MAG: UDP-N-acetylmuramate--L-alanine ligase, partial [Firmicutes bacterium]|nr:UDP-N-acetylmuramate--L-alanine ligase [Bacillota bacterium]
YSAAVSKENPELKAAMETGIPTATRAEALGALMAGYENSIAISGTHGKTTTTSMISLILEHAATDPTILVGGNLAEFNGNVKVGKSDYFVTEACEYMDSFLSLRPQIEIILNIDSDHLDYFKDIDHITSSFQRFADLVPANGTLIAYDANPFIQSILETVDCNVVTFGFSDCATYHADNIKFNAMGMPSFDVYCPDGFFGSVQLSVPGEHNIANSLAAIACCHSLGVSPQSIISTLVNYTGTQRRFDVVGSTKDNVRIVDDYAHHPTEIKATLSATKNIQHNKLWCLFQPHTYTRTMALFDEFAEAFADADKLILAEIYAAREKNIYKISSKSLATEIKKRHPEKDVYFFDDFDDMASFVYNNADEGDLVLTMGAGDICKVAEMILDLDNK